MVIEVEFAPHDVLEVDLDDDDEPDASVGDRLADALVRAAGLDDAESQVRAVAVAAGLRVNSRRRRGGIRLVLRRRLVRPDGAAMDDREA